MSNGAVVFVFSVARIAVATSPKRIATCESRKCAAAKSDFTSIPFSRTDFTSTSTSSRAFKGLVCAVHFLLKFNLDVLASCRALNQTRRALDPDLRKGVRVIHVPRLEQKRLLDLCRSRIHI